MENKRNVEKPVKEQSKYLYLVVGIALACCGVYGIVRGDFGWSNVCLVIAGACIASMPFIKVFK